ncbi:MAG TPA: YdcF family protein [Caulobacterales bacterium]|nr:YdcF family protein [Caulobacterales bacterium]
MSALRMFLSLAFAGLVLAFAAGFWSFAAAVRAPAAPAPRADAIVALTGGSLQRLQTGVRLLKEGKGERLLISGVNRDVADHELFSRIDVDDHLAECCVDLGRSAEDTLGNASETADWARKRHYTSLILVTDDYHMPRARTELALAMPDARIYPYPIRTRWTDPALWRSDLSAAGRLGGEYVKYLMIRTREALINLSGAHKKTATSEPSSA